MTGSIKKWQLNGLRTVKNTPAKNCDLWEEMIEQVQELASLDMNVDFWLVLREMNKEVDELANMGLDSDFCFGERGLQFIVEESDFIGGGM